MWHTSLEMAEEVSYRVRMGGQGRLVVPVELRDSLGLEPGSVLIARQEDGRLVLERREDALRRLRARFKDVPRNVDLAGELLADRREDARRELAE